MSRNLPSLGRKSSFRAPKRKFLIITEGKNTEPDYFNAINSNYSGAIIELKILKAAGVPITIAKKAVEAKQNLDREKRRHKSTSSFILDDEVWAAFDCDEHPRVNEAINICETANVGVAFSNPCFELWLILHYKDFDKPDDRHQVQREFGSLCSDYSKTKGKRANCIELIPKVSDAEQRAELQIARRYEENNELGAPSTTVFKLTKALRNANEEHARAT